MTQWLLNYAQHRTFQLCLLNVVCRCALDDSYAVDFSELCDNTFTTNCRALSHGNASRCCLEILLIHTASSLSDPTFPFVFRGDLQNLFQVSLSVSGTITVVARLCA